jgi:hypothetical protein
MTWLRRPCPACLRPWRRRINKAARGTRAAFSISATEITGQVNVIATMFRFRKSATAITCLAKARFKGLYVAADQLGPI